MEPFHIKIVEKDLSVNVEEFHGYDEKDDFELRLDLAREDLYSDWNIYRGIMFHLISNAIKFSSRGNNIQIKVRFVRLTKDKSKSRPL